jgi:Ca2+-binding RTX toxin-like protein
MVSFVTIHGSQDQTISIGFDTNSNFLLAEQVAAGINAGIATGAILTEPDNGVPAPTVPASVAGAFVQTQNPFFIMPQGYSIDLVTKPGPAVVFGSGAPGETILSDVTTDLTFIASSGSGTVLAGGGQNRLFTSGSGDWSLYSGNGNDVISALDTVNATIGAGGGSNAILLGSGKDVVFSTGDDSISGGSGAATVDASGASRDQVNGGNSQLLFIGGTGGTTIFGGTGSDTYLGSAGYTGSQYIVGGSAGNNYLMAGDGVATLVGGGNNDKLMAYGISDQVLTAGSGNETLSALASSGNDSLTAGAGNDVLTGGSGSDTFVGGLGNATVNSPFGNGVFEFINGQAGGTELVTGIFQSSSIKIDLVGYSPNEANAALASQTSTNGSVTIGLSDGTKITFQDITSLSKSNFS